jgi:hypothetical protein
MGQAPTPQDDRTDPVLTDDQRAVLELIYAPFREGGEWPEYQYVERAIYRLLGQDARELLASFPPGLIYPDPSFPDWPAPGTRRWLATPTLLPPTASAPAQPGTGRGQPPVQLCHKRRS